MNYLNQVLSNPGGPDVFFLDRSYCYGVFSKVHADRMKKALGVAVSEGASLLEYLPSEMAGHTKQNLDRALKGEEVLSTETFENSEKGTLFYETRYSPAYEEGKVSGVIVFSEDVTEKKGMEIRMNESEQLLASINWNIWAGIFRSTEKGGLVYVNPELVKMFGFKDGGEPIASDVKELYKDKGQHQRLFDLAKKDGAFHDMEIEFTRRDQTSFWGIANGSLVRGVHGEQYLDVAIRDISQQKEGEFQLRKNQRLLESINQNINEGIYRSDAKGLIYVNMAFANMFGYASTEEIMQTDPAKLYKSPADRSRLVKRLNKDGFFENEQVTLYRKNGEEFVALVNSIVYEDEQGNTFWDGAIRDVTEQLEVSKKIWENEQLLQSINHNIHEAIYRSINRKGLVYINEGFARMFGYRDTKEILEGDAINLYKDAGERRKLGDELVNHGSITNREVEFRRKDGSTFWGYLSSNKVEGDDGVIYFDGAIRDITVEKEAERALKHYTEMQKMLMDISTRYINLPLERIEGSLNVSLRELGEFAQADRAYIYDFNLVNGNCNCTHEWCAPGIKSEIENLQNLPLSTMPGLVKEHLKGWSHYVSDTIKLGHEGYKSFLMSMDIRSVLSVPMMYDNTYIGFVGFDFVKPSDKYPAEEMTLLKLFAEMLVNIRIRIQDQKELHKLLETTTTQNKRLKDFSYITSHNFRSSVANLIGITGILFEDPGNMEYLNMLKLTTEKLNETIKNLNELLNFEKEITVLERTPCNVSEAVTHILELHNQIIKEKNIEIVNRLPPELKINAFPAYLDSIFHNLIMNAIKYGITPSSSVIEIGAEENKEDITIFIRDFGIGIDLEKHGEKVFKLGARFHSSNKDGQGLGLFMTRHQVESMGGKIEVESEVDKGAVFKVTFERAASI